MTWTWWMTLLAIFAALVLIGCIPVGVDARYNAEGVFLAAKLGPIRLQLLPQKPKKKKKQQKKPEKAPEKPLRRKKSQIRSFPAAWTKFCSCWILCLIRSAICAASSA